MLEKSMAPHLPFYGYTAFGSQYSNPASFLASLIVNSSVCQPLLNMYKDAVMYRFKSYGLRYDDKNIHTPIFFRAINKFNSKEQQQYLRRVNRGFDCLTKKEKVPQNVWGTVFSSPLSCLFSPRVKISFFLFCVALFLFRGGDAAPPLDGQGCRGGDV
jgi:hypothetical protein